MMAGEVFTIGHSTRSLDEFLALLRENGIQLLADIRRYPGSRRYPHFSSESLRSAFQYVHMPELGGRRSPRKDSPNTGWHNDQFRAYADHMATPEFQSAVDTLVARPERTVVMCAEAVPWRCHRNLLSDELVRRGIEVTHILGPNQTQKHQMNPMAVHRGDHLEYPGEQQRLLLKSPRE